MGVDARLLRACVLQLYVHLHVQLDKGILLVC